MELSSIKFKTKLDFVRIRGFINEYGIFWLNLPKSRKPFFYVVPIVEPFFIVEP